MPGQRLCVARLRAAVRLLLLGLLLIGVSLLYFLFREQLGQAFLLGLLGVLAMTGVFYLFGSAVNIIQFAPHGADLELSQAFVDSLPEGTIITDAKGRIIYANKAYATMTGVANAAELRSLEAILANESGVSDVIYRLASAARDGLSGQEELRLSRPLDPAREPVPTWYRVKARPVIVNGEKKAHAWFASVQ